MLPEKNAHSRDCYSFGILMKMLISYLNDHGEWRDGFVLFICLTCCSAHSDSIGLFSLGF